MVTRKFCVLATVYAGTLLIANILANKVIMPFGYVLPCAVIIYPMTYILSDLMTECQGIQVSRVCIMTNTLLNLFMSLIFMVAVNIPSAPFADASAFNAVLGNTPRIVISSLVAYYAGDMVNSYALSFFKAKLRTKKYVGTFFFRSIMSSLLGQIFDTMGFIFLAFYGTIPNEMMFMMMINQFTVKIAYQIIFHPLTTKVVDWWKRVEGADVVDEW